MSTGRKTVSLPFVDVQVDGGIATIAINRPRAGNALNWALLEQLRRAVSLVAEAADVQEIVIQSAGKRFVSGADVAFFVRCLETNDLPRIVSCIRASQEVFAQIAACPKPIVAAVQGAAVGGGVELAIACHAIVATPRASFSLPETGLGILPFSGGTYRLPARIGAPLAKWLVYTGYPLSAPQALKLGLIQKVVMPDELPAAARTMAQALRGSPSTAASVAAAPNDDFTALRSLFDSSNVQELRALGTSPNRQLNQALKAIASRPLPALEYVEALINRASTETPEQGAAAALEAVPVLFRGPDVAPALQIAAQQQASWDKAEH